jgi:phospholipid-binding lipoprotein MlaA
MMRAANWRNRLLCFAACLLALTALEVPAAAGAPVKRPAEAYVDPSAQYPVDVYDPWEGFNRGVYRLNYYLDYYLLLPAVDVYEFVVPTFARRGIHNFLRNLNEPRNFVNSLLQGRAEGCVNAVMRFTLNTSLGIGGLLDPATPAGYRRRDEDFGQTLGVWGMGPGPYLVLPMLGPSSLRDGSGLAADMAFYNWWTDMIIESASGSGKKRDLIRYGLFVQDAVDTRSALDFRYFETGSPFEYELVRFLYSKWREFEIRY